MKKEMTEKGKKKSLGIRIDEDLHQAFTAYCREEGYSKSGLVEKLIRQELRQKKGIFAG